MLVSHPSVVLILGKRGSGKTALGYRILEMFRYRLAPYVVGIPNAAAHVLPAWIGIENDLESVPNRSVVLIDEAHLRYHSRESQAKANLEMSRLLNLSRQCQLTIIFVAQEARQIHKNIASSADVIVYKEPSSMQVRFERNELRDITEKARIGFAGISTNRHRWNYVYAPDADFEGMTENELPTFWTDRLSNAFAESYEGSPPRTPKRATREQKIARTKALHAAGWSQRQIMKELDISKGTVANYLKDYPYS